MKRILFPLTPWAFAGLLAALLALPLAAEEGPDAAALLRAALAKDALRSQRLFEADKARASLAALTESSFTTLSASSGQILASLPEDGGSITAAPSIGLALGAPWNTSLSLGASFGYDLAAGTFDSPKPTLSLTQALGDLIWGEKPDLDEASARKALGDAEAALAAREAAVTQALYTAIRAAVQADYLAAQAEYARALAARALDNAIAAKSAAEGSATLAKLRLDLQAAESSLRAKRRGQTAALDALEALAGARPSPPPLPPDPGAVAAPDAALADETLAVAAARRRLELVTLQTRSETEPDKPSLDAVLSAGKASSDYASGSWDYAGRLVFSHEGFQASAGGGVISRSSGGRTSEIP
ncbi:MAG: hypothetical protein JNG85_00635, partial [Spirochaetaceae bacterium]|nr:hypothetical protein [Spirochaetaceae bacterium]